MKGRSADAGGDRSSRSATHCNARSSRGGSPSSAPRLGICRELSALGSELQALDLQQQILFDPSVSPNDNRLTVSFPPFTRQVEDESAGALPRESPATKFRSSRQRDGLDEVLGELAKPVDLGVSPPPSISAAAKREAVADASLRPLPAPTDTRLRKLEDAPSKFRIGVRQQARPVTYAEAVDRTRKDNERQEKGAVRFAAASAAVAAAATAVGADADQIECFVTVEEEASPVQVSQEKVGERAGSSGSETATGGEQSVPWSTPKMVQSAAVGPRREVSRVPSPARKRETETHMPDAVSEPRVYSHSRWVDERRGEGGAPPGQFPFPKGLTEMQERMEEEWIDRERRLRAEHKRELERAVAHASEKLSREYSRRLVFELQEQEKALLAEMHERHRQALAEIRSISESKTDAQEETQRFQHEASAKEHQLQKVLHEARLLESEREALAAKVQHLEAENASLHAALASLEKQTCSQRAKEEDLQLRLDRLKASNDRLQVQLQHEQQLAANFAQKRRGLEREVEVLDEKRAVAEREWKRVAAELRELQERQAGLCASNAHLQNELDNAIRHGKNLEQRIDEDKSKDDERQKLSQRVEKLEEEKETTERRHTDEITSLRNRIKHLDAVECQLRTTLQDFNSQNLEVKRLRDENATLLAELRHQNKEDYTKKLDQQALHNDLITVKQENTDLRKELSRLIKERNSAGSCGSLPPYTPARPNSLSTAPSPDNPLAMQLYSSETPPVGGPAGGRQDPMMTEHDASVCPSLTGTFNRRCFTSAGKPWCVEDPSIPPSNLHREAFDSPTLRAKQTALRCPTSINPPGRRTQPPPAAGDASNPIQHVHYPTVASRVGMRGDHPSYMYEGYHGELRQAAALGALAESGPTRGISPAAALPVTAETPEQIASLESQLLLLATERKRIEGELSKIPSARGRTARERQQLQCLESRLAEVDGTMHRMKQTLFQAQRRKN
ncbi:conserved hypothetical protein [Neospora caninum Liverpool]|uniref:Uncharacterized protein n=1 Tax=Neospora caninum (strain Liverpool) TaxID=572307 RepID=F0VH45_NEOCL|nr:conserved hypothetical protein [Neospora caninum Liverpool]CBZ53039.1 conserved hypothetical protein [Neospora caninum Liverpool]CEL67023.1 TPA: hypothetical protein BN1204_028280 [Neospora caninum Liverpool]|eukprot:XP_003883071.1 conserved hypothetical protein [Neospora caninum Liverpool]